MNNISIIILTKNSERTIENTLKSTLNFSDVLILDTGSTDSTLSICQKFPHVRIASSPFKGFGTTHNIASNLATNDWVLSLDSDEVLSEELLKELTKISLDKGTIYEIRRHNYFNGKRITTCGGWDPDYVSRLYNKKHTKFSDDLVHEKILHTGMKKARLKGHMSHTPYLDFSDFLRKMESYSQLFYEQNKNKKKPSLFNAILHGLSAFIKSYVWKLGFTQGAEGFIISAYNAQTTYYKYVKLMKIQ
ncbi:MAG: glycosyltransferase family 2 protein [Chlamydiae bacterium]|nr:glycosyltransferase family 2 protein [Chlamydiota bacterium]